jgi:hypothetical protein
VRAQPRAAPVRSRAARLALFLLLIGFGSAAAQAAVGAPPVIPWLDQRPHRASAHPPLAAPCRAGRLHAHLFLQGATGSLLGGVELTNAGHAPCSLLAARLAATIVHRRSSVDPLADQTTRPLLAATGCDRRPARLATRARTRLLRSILCSKVIANAFNAALQRVT